MSCPDIVHYATVVLVVFFSILYMPDIYTPGGLLDHGTHSKTLKALVVFVCSFLGLMERRGRV